MCYKNIEMNLLGWNNHSNKDEEVLIISNNYMESYHNFWLQPVSDWEVNLDHENSIIAYKISG